MLQVSLPYHDKGKFLTELMMVLPITNLVVQRTIFGSSILKYWTYCTMRLHKDLIDPLLILWVKWKTSW